MNVPLLVIMVQNVETCRGVTHVDQLGSGTLEEHRVSVSDQLNLQFAEL